MDDCTVIQGETLRILQSLEDASADALITDPPYSSGGMYRGDRAMSTTDSKYTQSEQRGTHPDFGGDNRDQRSWGYWTALWLSECVRIVKPGGYLLCFVDWRQLSTLTDAFQAGGAVWRGLVPWDKGGGARAPHTGYFRHQCEYIVWGSVGALPKCGHGGPWSGCLRYPVKPRDKFHQAGKPVELMRELVKIVPPGGTVLDCFAGSGTTGIAAMLEGRRSVLIEREPPYIEIIRRRLDAARQGVEADHEEPEQPDGLEAAASRPEGDGLTSDGAPA